MPYIFLNPLNGTFQNPEGETFIPCEHCLEFGGWDDPEECHQNHATVPHHMNVAFIDSDKPGLSYDAQHLQFLIEKSLDNYDGGVSERWLRTEYEKWLKGRAL